MSVDNRYRPDIDGLRAIAVGLVILYHLRPEALPSGYIGVDIFFVISGYVVANSALAKVTGRPIADMAAFWLRRIRRIVPPLVLVVSVGALAAAAVFPPFPAIPYETIFRTGATSLFGLSNLYLDRTATNYFLLDAAQLNPFLHTWSLGIEEQYYIVFALLAIGLPSLLRMQARRTAFLIGLLAVIVGGSVLMAIVSPQTPLSKFYLPHTRIWEIGLGSLAAITGLGRSRSLAKGSVRTALRLALLATVIALAFLPHADGLYPTIAVFAACLASLGLVSLTPADGARLEPLALRPIVYVGLISYGLYLWHWVVLFILQMTIGTTSALAVGLAVGVPLALSAASYRFIERPFRDRRRMSDARVLVAAVAGVGLTLGLLAVIHQSPGRFYAGAAQDWAGDWMPPPQHAYAPGGKITKLACHLSANAPEAIPEACIATHGKDSPTLLSVGDSHAFSDWTMLSRAHDRGWNWAAMSMDSCTLSLGRPDCRAYWDKVPGYIATNLKPGDVVFVAVAWSGEETGADFAALTGLARAAAVRGATLVIEAPLPVIPRASFLCLPEGFRTHYEGCAVSRAAELERVARATRGLDALARTEPNVRVFHAFDLLCPEAKCAPFRDGKPLVRDSHHLSAWGSGSLAPAFIALLETTRR